MRTTLRRLADLVVDASVGLLARPGRLVLTLAGILVGTASLVTTSGLAGSAAANVVATFDRYAATHVSLTAVKAPPESVRAGVERLAALPGVEAAGTACGVVPEPTVGRLGAERTESRVVEITAPGLDAIAPTYLSGGPYTQVDEARGSRVAVIGLAPAQALGISDVRSRPSILIDGQSFTVVGVLDDAFRRPVSLAQVLVPPGSVRKPSEQCGGGWEVIVASRREFSQDIGRRAAAVMSPEAPQQWTVNVPPDPALLRAQVGRDLTALYAALAAMSIVVGALGIGNTMSTAVLERTAEIGVRRALGFRRRDILGLFCLEAALVGLLGGIFGAALGSGAVLIIALIQHWPFVVSPWIVLLCPLLGALIGLLGGLIPALRAARLNPATAARS